MQTYYIKKGKRYIPVGVNGAPDLHNGVWLVETRPGRRSMTNLVYKLSDLPAPVDVQKFVSYILYEDKLTMFLSEFFEDGNQNGSSLTGGKADAKLYNVSVRDFATQIMKHLYKESELNKTKIKNTQDHDGQIY